MMNIDSVARAKAVRTSYRQGADLFKALAHPVRLQILQLLSQCEACVCHIQVLLGQRQPYISQQLTVLREAGLVVDRRDGAMVYYRLADTRIGEVLTWMQGELKRQGHDLVPLALPEGPVEGCSCPHCVNPN